ncbi:MAG: lipoprotein [Burkholderiaceae bacterium]|nr:lipoprotein [Burkholderiaceae bacterium]
MKFSAPAIAAALVLASLSSCGQRGPLYLPPPEAPPHSSPPAQPVQPQATPKQDDDKKDKQN